MLLAYVAPFFRRSFNFGSVVGTALGAAFIVCGSLWNKMSFSLQKGVSFFALVTVVYLVLTAYVIMRSPGNRATNQRVLILLGCRVDGDIPSPALEKRMDAAYFFLLANPDSVAILSGGQGRDENISEALCMKQHLTYRGISADRLIVEDKSVSTYQNIKYSKKILDELGETEAAIATSDYHQKRAELICKKFGVTAYAVSSRTDWLFLPSFVLRESAALIRGYVVK